MFWGKFWGKSISEKYEKKVKIIVVKLDHDRFMLYLRIINLNKTLI